jgi:hypothetical protein
MCLSAMMDLVLKEVHQQAVSPLLLYAYRG